jgi:iron complex outermembrane receptor protein
LANGIRLTLLVALLAAAPMNAQDSPAPQPSPPFKGDVYPTRPPPPPLDQVPVEIEKRPQLRHEVAGAVSVFDAEQIELLGIEDVEDLGDLVPGLHVTKVSGLLGEFTLRGIGTTPETDPAVAPHVNGIFRSSNQGLLGAFLDTQRIELSRGPAGTLYGRNATAGVINVLWNPPVPGRAVWGDVGFGNYDAWEQRGGFNLPLVEDRLLSRFAFSNLDRDGYTDNLIDGRNNRDPDGADDFTARGSLRALLPAGGTFDLRGSYAQQKGTPHISKVLGDFPAYAPFDLGPPFGALRFDGYHGLELFKQDVAAAAGPLFGFPGPLPQPFLDGLLATFPFDTSPDPALPNPSDVRELRTDADPDRRLRVSSVDGELELPLRDVPHLGDLQLNVLAGWSRDRLDQSTDFDGSELALGPFTQSLQSDLYTGEIRLSSAAHEHYDWLLGGFLFQEEEDQDSVSDTLVGVRDETISETKKGWAGFGHARFRPVEPIELSAGLRYNKDKVDRETAVLPFFTFPMVSTDGDASFGEWTGEGALRWTVADGHSLYAKAARGFRSGGFNDGDGSPFDPEIVRSIEAGSRSRIAAGRLAIDLTVFRMRYEDQQVRTFTANSVRIDNAASSTIWGAELELAARPVPEWRIDAFLAWLNAEFDDFCLDDPVHPTPVSEPGCPQPQAGLGLENLDGNRLPKAPRWKANLSTSYDLALGGHGTLTPSLSVSWQDKVYLTAFNSSPAVQTDTTRTDLRLIWRSPTRRWRVEAFVENVEDHDVLSGVVSVAAPIGATLGFYDAPRTYGLRVGFTWEALVPGADDGSPP